MRHGATDDQSPWGQGPPPPHEQEANDEAIGEAKPLAQSRLSKTPPPPPQTMTTATQGASEVKF